MTISNDSFSDTPKVSTHDYDMWLENIAVAFAGCVDQPMFRTDATDLNTTYLNLFARDERQYYNCHTCKNFLYSYGGLVTITPEGRTVPVMWAENHEPASMASHSAALYKIVSKAKVTDVFVTSEQVLGRPVTGKWTHMAVTAHKDRIYKSNLLTSNQREAEYFQDFQLIIKNLNNWSPEVVASALRLLESDTINRAEKIIGPIKWLSDLHEVTSRHKNQRRNLIWRAIATAPTGFAHFATGLPGVLLDDIAAGKSFEEIRRSLSGKMHGLQYQRPQVAPTGNQIEAAEKIVEKLGIAKSLVQRYAKLEDCEAVWKPTEAALASNTGDSGKVFSHLTPKDKMPIAPLELPVRDITWVKFRDTILPTAKTIEYLVPYGLANYTGLVTAADMEAPPILQWDTLEQRNPVSWYCYQGGSLPEQWGLSSYKYTKVTAITLAPPAWYNRPTPKHNNCIILLLEGAKDKSLNCGAIFPENLKPELHGIRATIEAYSKAARIEGPDEATACGLFLSGQWGVTIRVNGTDRFKLDRWD